MNLGGIDLAAYMKDARVDFATAVQHAHSGKVSTYYTSKVKPITTPIYSPEYLQEFDVDLMVRDKILDRETYDMSTEELNILVGLLRDGKWVRDPSLPGYRQDKSPSYSKHNPNKLITVLDIKAMAPAVSPTRSPVVSPPPPSPTTPPATAGGVRKNWSEHVPADLASDKIPGLVRQVFPYPAEALKPYSYPENMAVRFHHEGKTTYGATYSYTCAIHQSVLKYVFVMSDPALDVEVHFVEDCPVALGYRILFWLQEK